MTTSKRFTRGVVLSFLAAAFAIFAMVLSPLAGMAAPGEENADNGDTETAPATGDVDTAKSDASLIVHKFANKGGWTAKNGDGSEEEVPADAVPVPGVTFKAQKLDIDLSDSANWAGLDQLNCENDQVTRPDPDSDGTLDVANDGEAVTQVTGGEGKATFSPLQVGVYRVVELGAEGTLIAKKAAPFCVVIPQPGKDGGWNYNVNVYPKNETTDAEKVLVDTDTFKDGDDVLWDIKVNVPENSDIKTFKIVDTFDSRVTNPKVVSVKETGVSPEVAFATPADYSVTTEGQKVTVEFTETGLGKIVKGGKIEARVGGTLNLGTDESSLNNDATITVNDSTTEVTTENKDPKPGEDGDTDETLTFGKLKILKYEGADAETGTPLNGAEFKICADSACDKVVAENVTTANDGTVTTTLKAGATYYIQETKAPAGYKLNSAISEGTTVVKGATADFSLKNEKSSGPSLPVTGASGQVLMIAGGLAIVALAAGLVLVGIKRSRTNS